MSDFLDNYIKKNRPFFKKQFKYLTDNDWTLRENYKTYSRSKKDEESLIVTDYRALNEEFKLQAQLVDGVLDRVKYLVNKVKSEHKNPKFKRFYKFCLEIVEFHTERIDTYTISADLDAIPKGERGDEMEFQSICFKHFTKITDMINSFEIIDEEKSAGLVQFHASKIAPLSMHWELVKIYPAIQKELERKGIDFDSPPKNEFLINIENPPVWESDKHYWENSKETLQFYVDEFKKIRHGVVIDGVKILPETYFHINIFKAPIPTLLTNPNTGELYSEDIIQNPPLRDNEWFMIQDSYQKAKKESKMLFFAATRRASKTTFNTSHLCHGITIGKKKLVCAGGSSTDLGHVRDALVVHFQNVNPAFRIDRLGTDWEKGVIFGIKSKDNKDIPNSILKIANLDAGGNKKSEILAGFTPDGFILDEIMKIPFKSQLEGFKPALDSPYGKRCVAILSGCVCAGTKVYTNSGKIVNIEDLQKKEGIIGYNGKSISKEPITWIKPPAKKPCYRITTTGNNVIECSDDHPFLTSSPSNKHKSTFSRAEDLKIGEHLYMSYEVPIFGNTKNKDARLLGLLIGDGYNGKCGSEIALEGEDVYNYLNNNYEIKVMKQFQTKKGTQYRRAYITGSGAITREAGINELVSTDKRFPKNIYEYDKESLCELIGGYFDADGYVQLTKNNIKIRIVSISYQLIQDLKFNLLKLGIDCSISSSKREEICFEKYNHKKSWEICIAKIEDVLKFKDNIKLLSQDKQASLNRVIDFLNKGKLNRNATIKSFRQTINGKGDFFLDKTNLENLRRTSVKSIEYIGEKDVYNLTAGTTNTYLANGFVTHNTAGNEELSKDGFSVLNYPDANDILQMDWEALERNVPEEAITWKRTKFGTFIPGQMSAKDGLVKITTTLDKYLGIKNAPNLAKIKINVTDWIKAKEIMTTDRKKKEGQREAFIKEKLYFPFNTEEMLMSTKVNPFPEDEARAHLAEIREAGRTGRKVDLIKDTSGQIVAKDSEKELPVFPHQGGFHDSPVILFEPLPKEKPPRGLYVASLDDYKQEQASSDSLGCFIIYKRQSGNDIMGDRIVAIYTSRPNPHSKFHRVGHMLLEAFNAECLMENEDMEFKIYLDSIHQTEQWLIPSFNIAGDITLKQNQRRMYGISPNGNKSTIINKVVNYCKEPRQYVDEEGNHREVLGVHLIEDEMLLEEIINYKDGDNFDRITTFGIGLIQSHFLDSNFIQARLAEPKREEVKKEPFKRKLFTETRRRVI